MVATMGSGSEDVCFLCAMAIARKLLEGLSLRRTMWRKMVVLNASLCYFARSSPAY